MAKKHPVSSYQELPDASSLSNSLDMSARNDNSMRQMLPSPTPALTRNHPNDFDSIGINERTKNDQSKITGYDSIEQKVEPA